MKYIVCTKPGLLELSEKQQPVRKPNEALLQIKKVGVCGTDLHAYAGNQPFFNYPIILGHELAAVVLEIDDNDGNIKIGDKVVPIPYVSCGTCIACRQGKTNCCTNLQVLGVHADGGMQEQFAVPVDLLLPANNLSYDQMAIVEPLAIGIHAIRRCALYQDEFIAVIGCGPIGLGIIKFAQLQGAKVIAVDVSMQRLNYAKEQLGVDYTVNGLTGPVNLVNGITSGEMATAVFDATGNKQALESGPDYMAHGGRFVLVGLSKETLAFNHPAIHAKEATLMCSRNATRQDFEKVMNVLNQNLFPIESYITHRLNFEEAIDQFEDLINPKNGVIKATIDFDYE